MLRLCCERGVAADNGCVRSPSGEDAEISEDAEKDGSVCGEGVTDLLRGQFFFVIACPHARGEAAA